VSGARSGAYLGQRVPRSEDDRLLRGLGRYLDDLVFDGALEMACVRSPHAHARILNIDTEAARATPGVVAVLTAADLGESDRPLPVMFPRPELVEPRTSRPIARDEVNYVGQIVAVVLATDRYAAEDGRDAVVISWERLPVVVDLEAAAQPDSPLVHDDMENNIAGRIVQTVGDPDEAFARADVVFSRRYVLERGSPMPIETRAVRASFDGLTGSLTFWGTIQAPHPLRAALAAWFGLPQARVRVISPPDTGGSFGVKGIFFYPEQIIVPWAAMHFGRPVSWTEDRLEHFTAAHHERKQIHDVEVAGSGDGELLGLRDNFLMDTGAYVPYGLDLGRVTSSQIGALYRVPNIQIAFSGVYTNTITTTPYRGAGRPYTCLAIERALDDLAREVGVDRWEVRRRNFIRRNEFPYRRDGLVGVEGWTVVVDSGSYFEQLEMLEGAVDVPAFRARQARSREGRRWLGLGIACYVESTGGGSYEGAKVSVEPDTGKVVVTAAFTTEGQSHATTLAQVAAEYLSVDVADVEFLTGDTERFRWGVATYASRGAVLGGNAVARAAEAVANKARRLAANMLEADVEDIELVDGRAQVSGAPDVSISLRLLAKAARPDRWNSVDEDAAELGRYSSPVAQPFADQGPAMPTDEEPGLEADGFFSPQNQTWASGAHAAEVEVDLDTGEVHCRRYVAVHDCGRMINPMVVEGQMIGGIAQGVGGALYEQLAYDDDGQVQNGTLMDYLMPYATEVPAIELHHLETLSPLNPLGIKGAGEAGTIPVAAVFASAIEDALEPLGVRITEMPLNPQSIFEMLDAADPSGGHQRSHNGNHQ
jgi:aerobic carbon-monoxide dehydrogenase large subunit